MRVVSLLAGVAVVAGCSGGGHPVRYSAAELSESQAFKGCSWHGDIPEIRILVSNDGDRPEWISVRGRFSRDPGDTSSDLFVRNVFLYPDSKRLVVLRGDPVSHPADKPRKPACEMTPPPRFEQHDQRHE